ncbi:MAG: hypothetical protein H6669_06830 [Ardenticatenaceae bacterium]|nr:hypothetical protein [Ardenticatenaceae bacterium]
MNGRSLFLLLLLLLIVGCQETAVGKDLDAGETAVPLPTRPTSTPQPAPEPLPYGLVYPAAQSSWTEADRAALRRQLTALHDMGINTVIQTFSSGLAGTGQEGDWLIFLDEAERAEIKVIARLWLLTEEVGEPSIWNRRPLLAATGDHLAPLFTWLHEPLERFNSDRMRQFYTSIKEIAPDLLVAHYMGSMAFVRWQFTFSRPAFHRRHLRYLHCLVHTGPNA